MIAAGYEPGPRFAGCSPRWKTRNWKGDRHQRGGPGAHPGPLRSAVKRRAVPGSLLDSGVLSTINCFRSVCICVHPWPLSMSSTKELATDGHRCTRIPLTTYFVMLSPSDSRRRLRKIRGSLQPSLPSVRRGPARFSLRLPAPFGDQFVRPRHTRRRYALPEVLLRFHLADRDEVGSASLLCHPSKPRPEPPAIL